MCIHITVMTLRECSKIRTSSHSLMGIISSSAWVRVCSLAKQSQEVNEQLSKELGRVPEKEVLYSVDVVKANLQMQLCGPDVGIIQLAMSPMLACC